MLNTVAMADDYFSTNLFGKDLWSAISSSDKELALETSENDVNAVLGTSDINEEVIFSEKPYSPYQMAVFEWACYLHTNKKQINRVVSDRMSGVSAVEVDGIGKETYGTSSRNGYSDMIYKSHAGKFLNMIMCNSRIIR